MPDLELQTVMTAVTCRSVGPFVATRRFTELVRLDSLAAPTLSLPDVQTDTFLSLY